MFVEAGGRGLFWEHDCVGSFPDVGAVWGRVVDVVGKFGKN